ncbi:MAG: DUF4351 domain-containing protein [Thiocapsa sp.]|uniref:DUF4351 domain-containing protein n=1 Tax=Thiocapsa sp. TaxID=2024551 RepID=UPI001BCFED27|nr:DUF4351 domain-containing protein [Thiocapsa sp.]QVL49772.1 MAG: DUF4351 domain-containing protein [Thiocapsa sp.]
MSDQALSSHEHAVVADYDSPWKTVLERYFPDFLAFFFPDAHADIDWTHGYSLLDKELQKVVRDAELGRRWADSLIRVTSREGGEDWLLVHVEVQGRNQADFARRMFVYNYRIYDRYAKPVVSLAVLAEPSRSKHGEFGYARWGCRMGLRFPLVSLAAYRTRRTELESSANPFAVVTLAHLSARETAGSPTDRYQAKLGLIRSLYRRGFARQDILELFRFIDWVLTLPEGLEQQLWCEVQQFDEEKHMHYLSSIERMAQQKGIEQGTGQGQAKLLHVLVRQRFGQVPPEIEARIRSAHPDQLEQWALLILDARCLDDVFGATGEH